MGGQSRQEGQRVKGLEKRCCLEKWEQLGGQGKGDYGAGAGVLWLDNETSEARAQQRPHEAEP